METWITCSPQSLVARLKNDGWKSSRGYVQDRDSFVRDHDQLCERGMTAPIGHQQGQVLKELFVPGADTVTQQRE